MFFLIVLTLVLVLFESLFVVLARRFSIKDIPNCRSSHQRTVPTGGGIIFYVAVLFFVIWNTVSASSTWWTFLGSVSILALVSFIDDLHPLPSLPRLLIQLLVIGFVFRFLVTEDTFNWFILILLLGTGFVNAYNFMDGINGMLASYSIVTLGSLYYLIDGLNYYFGPYPPVMMRGIVSSLLVASCVFALFNMRRKALIFAGDVGAITLGFCIMFIMAMIVCHTGDASIVTLVVVYGIDSAYTIVQRLFEGDRITRPHRKHLYQLLANNLHWSHIKVSCIYAGVQLAVNAGFFLVPGILRWSYLIVVLVILSTVYFASKRYILRSSKNR